MIWKQIRDFYYNTRMDRLYSILIGVALVAVLYWLGPRRFDYTSPQKRQHIKDRITAKGISVQYYFISTKRLLWFNILTGGLFFFYWAYKQWQAIQNGYKSTTGVTIKYNPWLRSLFSCFTLYQLIAIVNRTCVYMRKVPAFPAVVWGSFWWAGLVVACLTICPIWIRLLGAILYLVTPYVLQRHINSLPKELPPSRIKWREMMWLLLCWIFWAALYVALHKLAH